MSRKKRNKRRQRQRIISSHPPQLLSGLSEADSLMRRKRWDEALALLHHLDQRYPHRTEVLTPLLNLYYELQDTRSYQEVCERLLQITPNDPEILLRLAGAYLVNMRPMLGLRTFRHFLDQWPDHDQAGQVRGTVAELEEEVSDVLAEMELTGEEGFELAAWHEEAQSRLDQGRLSEARKVEEKLLRQRPDYTPALNNLSQIYFLDGQPDQAVATAEKVLALDPDNLHALSNRTRYLCLSGQEDAAQSCAERLKGMVGEAVDVWVKKAEALSYLGDDQGVLDAFQGAEQAGHLQLPRSDPLLPLMYHLTAVAELRLGREGEARKHWQQALKLAPGLEVARDNLMDLRKPVDQRHAPWAFSLANWTPRQALDDLVENLGSKSRGKGKKAEGQALRSYLRRHPEIAGLLPLLLDRGDPLGREFALRTALSARTPGLLEALRDFALSQRGPDAMRHQAAQAATEAGVLPSGGVRLWMQGEWREVLLFGFEIHGETIPQHAPQVEGWLEQARSALEEGHAEQAESLLEQALELEPDGPDLWNQLAAVYEFQERFPEAEAVLHQIVERHPDDVFNRTSLARFSLSKGEIDQAKAWLDPLLSRKRLHFGELAALCDVQIELCLAENQTDGAHSWLDIWTSVDPDHPEIDRWRRRLGRRSGRSQRINRRR